jgi:hypothetical protein
MIPPLATQAVMNTPSTYVIPPALESMSSPKPLLAVPAGVAIGAVFGAVLLPDGMGAGAALGLAGGIVVAVAQAFANMRKAKEIWAFHNHAWYRATFPNHALSEGKVSCRHCGGRQIHVRNLMNQTFTRSHSCSQCGETLYFSPEKV